MTKSHLYNQITHILKEHPHWRERKVRHEFVLKLLNYRFPIEENMIRKFIDDYNTAVRYIQMIQKEDESTRGSDYFDGKALAQSHVLSLGYEVGYKQDIKNKSL